MKSDKNIAVKIWEILYPVGMYYVTLVISMFLARSFLGTDIEHYMLCQILASIVAIPVVYSFYRRDRILSQSAVLYDLFGKDMLCHVLWEVVIAAALSISLNNLISMSPLLDISQGYQEANENFYGGSLVYELIGSALIVPILEELLFRGVVYNRLRGMSHLPESPLHKNVFLGRLLPILFSAFLFGLFHFNLVQFVYAFLIGIVLALFMEKAGHMYGAVVGHVTANTIAVIRTETGWLGSTMDGSPFAWGISVGICIIGVALLLIYMRRSHRKRNTF